MLMLLTVTATPFAKQLHVDERHGWLLLCLLQVCSRNHASPGMQWLLCSSKSLLPGLLLCASCNNAWDLDHVYHAAQHRVGGFRAVFKEQAAENKFFESQELDVQHAQLATAMFLDPGAPPM